MGFPACLDRPARVRACGTDISVSCCKAACVRCSCGPSCRAHFLLFAFGCRYQGEWVDDKMTGRGYMIWADGRRYDGEWLENRCNGRGVLTYRDGRRYEGEYKLDKMHGRG